jgi:hypothetical protein
MTTFCHLNEQLLPSLVACFSFLKPSCTLPFSKHKKKSSYAINLRAGKGILPRPGAATPRPALHGCACIHLPDSNHQHLLTCTGNGNLYNLAVESDCAFAVPGRWAASKDVAPSAAMSPRPLLPGAIWRPEFQVHSNCNPLQGAACRCQGCQIAISSAAQRDVAPGVQAS